MKKLKILLGVGTVFLSVSLINLASSEENHFTKERINLNGGYYLLNNLCRDEVELPLITDIKKTPPTIAEYTKAISQLAKKTMTVIQELAKSDSTLQYNSNPLPEIEQDVRDDLKADKQDELLSDTKGISFTRMLLVSQIDATGYAHSLAKILAEQEKDSSKIKALKQISGEWQNLHRKAINYLNSAR